MGTFKSALVIASINFRQWKKDTRIWIIFIFIALMLGRWMRGFMVYAQDTGTTCTIFQLPILFRSGTVSIGTTKIMLYIGMLMILCDAPFFYPTTPYMVLRSRRTSWWIGECLYIAGAAFIYILFITLVSALLVLPFAEFGNDWGSTVEEMLLGSDELSVSEIDSRYWHIALPGDVIQYLYPSAAQLYTFVTAWASFVFLGLLMHWISLKRKSIFLGLSAASFFVFLDPVLGLLASWNTAAYWYQFFSPVTWSSVGLLDIVNGDFAITIPFAAIMYFLLIVSLIAAIAWRSKTVVIE